MNLRSSRHSTEFLQTKAAKNDIEGNIDFADYEVNQVCTVSTTMPKNQSSQVLEAVNCKVRKVYSFGFISANNADTNISSLYHIQIIVAITNRHNYLFVVKDSLKLRDCVCFLLWLSPVEHYCIGECE